MLLTPPGRNFLVLRVITSSTMHVCIRYVGVFKKSRVTDGFYSGSTRAILPVAPFVVPLSSCNPSRQTNGCIFVCNLTGSARPAHSLKYFFCCYILLYLFVRHVYKVRSNYTKKVPVTCLIGFQQGCSSSRSRGRGDVPTPGPISVGGNVPPDMCCVDG